jgi:hypothetical protein
MARRCRTCGRSDSRRHSRRSRTVFSQPGFWLLVIVAILIMYAVQTGRA